MIEIRLAEGKEEKPMPRRFSTTIGVSLLLLCATAIAARAQIQPSPVGLRLEEITTGLMDLGQFAPTDLAPLPDGTGRMAVATLGGKVRLLAADGTPIDSAAAPYIDAASIATDERGTTAVVFHPDFAVATKPGFGKVYSLLSEPPGTGVVDFPAPFPGSNHQQALVEWSTSDPLSNAPSFTRRDVIRFNQAFSIHNVNDLAFDAQGFLFVASGSEAFGSQSLASFNGSIFRIDPLHPSVTDKVGVTTAANGEYSYPNDNPFVGSGGGALPEIYAWGLRNPYRLTFDRDAGGLYTGDVGQATREEVDRIEPGKNYGWPFMEGTVQVLPPPSGATFEGPIFEYGRDEGDTVIGGYVYRGTSIPGLAGKYIFADFGRQFTPDQAPTPARLFQGDLVTGEILELLPTGETLLSQFLFSIGEDQNGELYLLVGDDPVFGGAENPDGRVLKIVAASQPVPTLTAWGLAYLACALSAVAVILLRRRTAPVPAQSRSRRRPPRV
jgi:glucose/arabinose dehydrogenase